MAPGLSRGGNHLAGYRPLDVNGQFSGLEPGMHLAPCEFPYHPADHNSALFWDGTVWTIASEFGPAVLGRSIRALEHI